jgi:hypothetical protein
MQDVHGTVRVVDFVKFLQWLPDFCNAMLNHFANGAGSGGFLYLHGAPCLMLEGERQLGYLDQLIVRFTTQAGFGPPEMVSIFVDGKNFTRASLPLPDGELALLITEEPDKDAVLTSADRVARRRLRQNVAPTRKKKA